MRQRVTSSATIRRAGLALGVGVAICLGPKASGAQDAPANVTIDVGDCVSLKSPDDRLACFERHVEAAKPKPDARPAPAPSAVPTPAAAPQAEVAATAAAPAPAAAPPSAVAAAPAPATAPPSAAAAAAPVAGSSAPPPPPEIVATVTELRETVPNAWLITLDNGQVWRQNIPQRFALKPGQRVTLHGTKWGASYRLSADALGGFIQVERVR
jgi:hypothetical protein